MPKRAAGVSAAGSAKKLRSTLDEVAGEWVCPITKELPVDPVVAEDGRIYERSAIASWLAKAYPLTSPVTNEKMGKRLLPAVQVRNAIRSMVASGAIVDGKADAWVQRLADEAAVAALQDKATAGDVGACHTLARAYELGEMGLPKDPRQSIAWYTKAADLGSPQALSVCGHAHIVGRGVAVSMPQAILMMGRAAERGSRYACQQIASWYAQGTSGFKQDAERARMWYRRMEKCACHDTCAEIDARAAEWLRAHP